jgi:hypothetical protein
MYKQRTRYFGRTTMNVAIATLQPVVTVTGLRGAFGLFVKVWGGSGGAGTISAFGTKICFDGVTPSTSTAAANFVAQTIPQLGNCTGTEANPLAWIFFTPINTTDGANNAAALGGETGFLCNTLQLQVSCTAISSGVNFDIWILDSEAGATGTDTFMVP